MSRNLLHIAGRRRVAFDGPEATRIGSLRPPGATFRAVKALR